MASFTSNPSQFNSYISQLPIVEEMSKVGMEKQAKYDQGIQRIQTQIDNVAGMDVLRDVDKSYLESKMNELGNNLKFVAAGDFSNYQLVNSVGGMVNQIGKDENVQNAVYSTMKYKKGAADMAAANKAGKGSPSNDWDFNNKASKWMNSKDLKTTFSANYDPYTDYKKNALELIKSLTKDETITDDAFATDSKGNLVITDALVRKKLSGISPEKIQQALMSGLTPADFKQMQIDGRYNYSNVDDQTFANQIQQSHAENVKFYTEQRAILDNAKMSTTSNPERAKLESQIASIDKVLANINNEYTNTAQRFAMGDYESAKAQLHTSNFINNFSKAFSYTQTSQTIENNPYADMAMRREIKNQDWKKFQLQYEQDERQFNMKHELDIQDLALKKEANDLKKEELGTYGGLPYTVNQSDLPLVSLAKVKGNTEADKKAIDESDFNFIKQNGKDQTWLNQQHDAWLKSPSAVDPLVAQHFNGTEQRRRDVESNLAMITEINNEAISKFGDIYSKIPTNLPSIKAGGTIYTPKDIVDFNTKLNKYIYWKETGSTEVGSIVYNDELARKELSNKDYNLYLIERKKHNGEPLGETEKALSNMRTALQSTVNFPYQKTLQEINDYTGNEVKKRIIASQGMSYTIDSSKPYPKGQIAGLLASFADKAEKMKGKLEESPNFDVAKAREIATSATPVYTIKVVEGTELAPSMYEITATADGKTVQFNVTPEEKRASLGNMFESSAEVQAIRPYQAQIRKMGGYSTGKDQGPTTIANSYLRSIDFPNAKVYGVTGNIITPDGGQSYSIRLNLHDKITGRVYENIPYPPTGMLGEEQLAKALAGLNDAAIFEMIYGKPATVSDLNKVKNASKNPFQ